MPSKSKKQAELFRAACKSEEFAREVDIDQKKACEWYETDKSIWWKNDVGLDDSGSE